jgi:hypothetical protein
MSVNDSVTQNLLPVQAYFNLDGSFNTFIGQGKPFYATTNPIQSGLTITNSTLDSSPIGFTSPSTGAFTNITTTTGQITTQPTNATDIVNLLALQSYAAGISWKQPVACATLTNITLSGLQTIDGYTTLTGDRVIVKNQSDNTQNGIYIASSGVWSRSSDANTWNELVSAIAFVEYGSQAGSAWFCTVTPGGTLGSTAVTWAQFTTSATYSAGTGLTLSGFTFSITNTAVTAGSYGSASNTLTATVNAQGQLTALAATPIAIANTQVSGLGTMSTQNANNVAITGGSINGTSIGGSSAAAITGTTITATSSFSGSGSGLTGTASGLSIGGNAATATTATSATSATTATNIAGGSAGALPYQVSSGSTTFLSAGSNGQYLTLSSGVPAWTSLPTTVSSFSAGTTGFSPSSPTTGSVTLSGTLNVANGGTGVTSSSGANSVVLRDSNANISVNCLFEGFTSQAASSTTITLTASSVQNWTITGSGGQTIQLPDATTLPNGALFTFNNNQSSGTIVVKNNSSTTVCTTQSGAYIEVILLSNSTSAGSWDYHNVAPANVSWSTNTLDYAGSITSATWNGSTIAYNRGGTGQSSAFVAGGIAYGASTSALAITAAGTSGQFLQSTGTGTPIWATPVSYATVTDDTTTNTNYYPLLANQTSGSLSTEYTSSTKLKYNPSTGILTATSFTGAGTGLTGTASSLSIGGNAATATSATTATNIAGGAASQLVYQTGSGATGFIANGTSGQVLQSNGSSVPTWVTFTGGATITDDTTTNATRYPLFAAATSGTLSTAYTSSTELKYNPSTGDLSAQQQVANNGIFVNNLTVGTSYSIASGYSGLSVGPVTVASGKSVTVPSGSRWVIL